MFNYISNGKINLTGCSGVFKSVNFATRYKKGDIVFLKKKAINGTLESIAIKDIRILGGKFSFNQVSAIYTDTYNFLYNADELVTLEDAVYVKNEYCFINSNFKYTSNIKLNLNSCNGYNPQPQITTKFQIGDIVFLKKKANIGILESIFVKNIKKTNEVKCNFINAIYIDNTNFYYNENELVAESEAKIIIKNYVIEKIQSLNQSKITCNISKNVVAKCKG